MTLVVRHANYGDENRVAVVFYEVPDEMLPISSEVPSTSQVELAVRTGFEIDYQTFRLRHPGAEHRMFFGWSMFELVKVVGSPFVFWKTARGSMQYADISHPVEVWRDAQDMPLGASNLRLPEEALAMLAHTRPDVTMLGELLALPPEEVSALPDMEKMLGYHGLALSKA